jgi:GNAT superfamily N-acetyltransferase
MNLKLKPFSSGDVDFAVQQASREGWATGRPFFQLHLEHDPAGAFVFWLDDRRVGLVTATGYEATGWVGNLIVEPEFRSRGIGRRLMERAIEHLEAAGLTTLNLDADPPGVPLYQSLSFVEESNSLRYKWAGSGGSEDARVEQLAPADLPEMLRLDRESFGDRRDGLLPIIMKQAESALGVRENGRLTGFIVTTDSTTGIRIGPCAAEHLDAAEALLTTIMHRHSDRVLTLGITEENSRGAELLESLGFEATAPCLRMVRGRATAAGDASCYFSIAGGDIG